MGFYSFVKCCCPNSQQHPLYPGKQSFGLVCAHTRTMLSPRYLHTDISSFPFRRHQRITRRHATQLLWSCAQHCAHVHCTVPGSRTHRHILCQGSGYGQSRLPVRSVTRRMVQRNYLDWIRLDLKTMRPVKPSWVSAARKLDVNLYFLSIKPSA